MGSTSPSLYIKFPSLEAADGCGSLGISSFTSATLAFAPGELSTLVNWCPGHGCTTSLQAFDPADMPCGPPEPVGGRYGPGGAGDYSPLFAPITKLNKLRPEWWNCTAEVGWNGWDPPRTLEPATAMIDPITSADKANAQPTNAAPSPTIPSLPTVTGSPDNSLASPSTADSYQEEPHRSASRMAPDMVPSSSVPLSPAAGAPVPSKLADIEPAGDPSKAPQTQVPAKPGNGDPITTVASPDPSSPVLSAPVPTNQPPPKSSNDPGSSQNPEISQISGTDPSNGVNPVSNIGNPIPGNSPQPTVSIGPGYGSSLPNSADPGVSKWQQPTYQPGPSASQPSPLALGGFTFSAIPSDSEQDVSESLEGPGPTATPGPGSNQGTSPIGGSWPNIMPTSQANPPQAPGLIIGGSTLLPGGPAVSISGTPISLASSHIIIGSSTVPLPSSPPSPAGPATYASPQAPAAFTFAGQTYTANPAGFAIGSASLLPGGPAVSISGTPISLASSQIIVGASTIALPSSPPQPHSLPTFTIAGQTYTANPSGFAIGSTTLLPGAPPISISGTPISLVSSALIIGTSTLPLTPIALTSPPTPYVTIGSGTLALGASNIVVGGTTLTPGASAITANGVPVSLGSSMLVIGTRTETFAPAQASGAASPQGSEGNVGDMIMSGLGAVGGGIISAPSSTPGVVALSSPTSNGTSVKAFTGDGSRRRSVGRGGMSYMSLVLTFSFVAWI